VLGVLDDLLDRTVAPSWSRLGYLARSRGFTALPDGALAGRVAAVTGGGGGLGLAIVEGLARLGARVHLVVRDTGRGEAARAGVTARLPEADLVVTRCDVSDLEDVRRAADDLAGVHVLVHNAGVLPASRTVTRQGHELTLATHVLGPHLLTALLAPALERVVVMSSGGMYTQKLRFDEPDPWNGTVSYARTKRMQVVLAGLWAQRLVPGAGVHAVHPGWADTPGVTMSLPRFAAVLKPVLRSAEEGADTAVWLAAADPATLGTGRFWLDRRARSPYYLPGTRETPADRERLWALCERLAV